MIGTRSNTALYALAIVFAIVLPASAFANAALGPDMPAWTIHPAAGDVSDRTSEASDRESVPVPDPLDPIIANVARAEDLVDSDHPSEALATIQAAFLALDRVPNSRQGVSGRELYVHYATGQGTSKVTNVVLERALGVPATARNWNTVGKLLALARELEGRGHPFTLSILRSGSPVLVVVEKDPCVFGLGLCAITPIPQAEPPSALQRVGPARVM
jgi:hypothetical protein